MSTRLETTGASAGPVNRRYAWSSPNRTTDSPYRTTWGENTASMLPVALIMSGRLQCALALAGLSREAIGPAAAATPRVSGTRMMTDQVSSAEVIWLTCALSAGSAAARSADRARTGTIALVSAPPRTSS